MDKILVLKTDYKAIKEILHSTKKTNKEVLKYIYINKNILYVTNGEIAFRKIAEMDYGINGVYEIIKVNKHNSIIVELLLDKKNFEYPDIKRIYDNMHEINQADMFNLDINDDDISLTSAVLRLYEKTDNAYSVRILKHLQVYRTPWEVISHKKDNAAFLQYDKVTIIILPFIYRKVQK